jgi:hypothetical protein
LWMRWWTLGFWRHGVGSVCNIRSHHKSH